MQVLVGEFSEQELIDGFDQKAIKAKKEETGLKYINSKIIKKRGVQYMRVWLCDLNDCDDFKKEAALLKWTASIV